MRRRLVMGAAYMLLVVILGLAVPFAITLGRRLTDELGGRVEREAFAVAAALEDLLETTRYGAMQPAAERFASRIGGRVLVTDPEGVLLADSLDPPGDHPPSYASRPEIAAALAGRANWDVRHSRTLDEDLLVSAVPVRSGDRILGTVRISYPTTEIQRSVHRAYRFLGFVGAVALLTGLGLAAGLARWIVRPLKAAGAAARRIAQGDLRTRVPVEGPGEVQELARDLNLMTAQLADVVRANREFAANASHQLRTPLAALRLSLEEAIEGGNPIVEVRHALDQAGRLERMVDALLALGANAERPSSATDLVAAVTEAVRSLPRGRTTVDVAGAGTALADPERVRQVTSNLVANAHRFARSRVRVSIIPTGATTLVRVDDDGPGVAEDERDRVFDRFFRGRRSSGPGSGLGLAVARELARADGAQIRITESDLGGARFEVAYPAAASDAGTSSEVVNRKPTPRSVRI